MARPKSAQRLFAELSELKAKHAMTSSQMEKYRRFIKEAGHHSEYLCWLARDIGCSEETVSELGEALANAGSVR